MSELGGRHASAHHGAHPLPHTSEVGGRRAGPRAMARPIAYITCTMGTGVPVGLGAATYIRFMFTARM